jgi:hypothetical protein
LSWFTELLIPALCRFKPSRSLGISSSNAHSYRRFRNPLLGSLLLQKTLSYLNFQPEFRPDVEMLPRYKDRASFSEISTVLVSATELPCEIGFWNSRGQVEWISQDISMLKVGWRQQSRQSRCCFEHWRSGCNSSVAEWGLVSLGILMGPRGRPFDNVALCGYPPGVSDAPNG